MTAAVALLDMATERRGPANLDRRHHPALCRGQRATVLLTIGIAVAAEHIRHFRPRPAQGSTAQKGDGSARLASMGIGRGSRSSGLVVAQTLLVAIRRYLAVVSRLLWPISN
jgi:hypothetical protein